MPALLSRKDEVRALRLARSQPESLPQLNKLAERLKAQVVEIVLRDARVRERLAHTRHRVVAVDYSEDKDAAGRVVRLGDVVVYDYERDVLVVASVDSRTGSVASVFERAGVQPPITDEERDEAIRLVAESTGVGQIFRRKRAHVVAFPTPSYAFDAEPKRRRHRGCTLYVTEAGGRVVAATVDLSAQELVPDERLPEGLRSRASRRSPPAGGSSTSHGSRAKPRGSRAPRRSTSTRRSISKGA
jgi:hypothetical protein